MSKLSTWVKYNNWESLEENIGSVNSNNFTSLLVGSVKYHSKECFDILIGLPNAREWINKRQRGIKNVFINYEQAPNKSNEYYVNKVLPLLAYINTYNISSTLNNSFLFDKIFSRIIKDKYSILDLMSKIIDESNFEQFVKVFDYLKSNQNLYPFFTNEWIQTNILYFGLIFDNVEVVKYLDENGLLPEYLTINTFQVSPLVLALTNIKATYWRRKNKKYNHNQSKCFEYLIDKKVNSNQNLLWSVFIDMFDTTFIDTYEFENDWGFDFATLQNERFENNFREPQQPLSNENLGLKLILNNDDDYDDEILVQEYFDSYQWDSIITLLDYLFEFSNSNSHVKNITKNILNVPNIDFIKNFTMCILEKSKNVEAYGTISKRTRRSTWRSQRNKMKLERICQALNVAKYIKENKLLNADTNPHANSSPFDFIKIDKKLKNNTLVKKILLFICKLYPVTEDISKNILAKIFTKTELKSLTKTLEKTDFDDLIKDIKLSKRRSKTKGKKSSKKKVQPINPDIVNNPIVNPNAAVDELELGLDDFIAGINQINQGEDNAYESDSNSDSDSDNSSQSDGSDSENSDSDSDTDDLSDSENDVGNEIEV